MARKNSLDYDPYADAWTAGHLAALEAVSEAAWARRPTIAPTVEHLAAEVRARVAAQVAATPRNPHR